MLPQNRPKAYFVTTAIPYVNAPPHVGFAMELVVADVLARYQRLRGRDVRFLTGTDENSLKNVQAAEAEGIGTAALVDRNAQLFQSLRELLNLSFDDFIRTSADARHRAGAEALWRACAERGDIYKRPYRGLYCVGCEQFYVQEDLTDGLCPEHRTRPDVVEEENYFFRLSKYEPQLRELLESRALDVAPEHYGNEVRAFVRRGLEDFSISRSSARARGWGIEVPGDPSQVMYVWFDALGNYISALDYAANGELFGRYWTDSAERVHVIGKGITRFHAVYWPAILLSAGLAVPTTTAVHGYLTVDGQKIGKSLGNAIDPAVIVRACGQDAVRYFLTRHIRSGKDGDFSLSRVLRARDSELADQLGNLLKRTVAMVERYYGGLVPATSTQAGDFSAQTEAVRLRFEDALSRRRLDDGLNAAWSLIEAANRYVVDKAPWKLAKHRDDVEVEAELATTLWTLAEVLRVAAVFLEPFIPRASAEIHRQLGVERSLRPDWERATRWGVLPPGTRVTSGASLFPKDA